MLFQLRPLLELGELMGTPGILDVQLFVIILGYGILVKPNPSGNKQPLLIQELAHVM